MDIYKWAEENNYSADYIDMNTGYIYKVQEYGQMKEGNPNARIRIVDLSDPGKIKIAKKKGDD